MRVLEADLGEGDTELEETLIGFAFFLLRSLNKSFFDCTTCRVSNVPGRVRNVQTNKKAQM